MGVEVEVEGVGEGSQMKEKSLRGLMEGQEGLGYGGLEDYQDQVCLPHYPSHGW
jgi:hypothetical protein